MVKRANHLKIKMMNLMLLKEIKKVNNRTKLVKIFKFLYTLGLVTGYGHNSISK